MVKRVIKYVNLIINMPQICKSKFLSFLINSLHKKCTRSPVLIILGQAFLIVFVYSASVTQTLFKKGCDR
jgi:hypothetical protein